MKLKGGRLGKKEIDFIRRHCDDKSIEWIAEKLNRRVVAIEKYIKQLGKPILRMSSDKDKEFTLANKPYWKELQEQFDERELELFAYHWDRIIKQFNKDVLPTEELQIIDVIKLEILMNRALKEQQFCILKIKELEEEIEQLRRHATLNDETRERIINLERQIASFFASKQSIAEEYKKLQDKKSTLFKNLKATRDQRIQRLESGKKTFATLLTQIMTDKEFREREGAMLEKMRMAVEEQKRKLSDYHEFADGMIDQPILTDETVLDDDVDFDEDIFESKSKGEEN